MNDSNFLQRLYRKTGAWSCGEPPLSRTFARKAPYFAGIRPPATEFGPKESTIPNPPGQPAGFSWTTS